MDTHGLHGILFQLVRKKVIKKIPTQVQLKDAYAIRAFWLRFFNIDKFEIFKTDKDKGQTFGYSVKTDEYSVLLKMERPKNTQPSK